MLDTGKNKKLKKNTEAIPEGLRTWIEISTEAINHNFKMVQAHVPKDIGIMSVVKSNAYGHGLVEYATHIVDQGTVWIGVDSIVEAMTLRNKGLTVPILVFGYVLPERFFEAAENDISITISSPEALDDVIISGEKIKIHFKIDTGLHRQGFLPEFIPQLISKISNPETKRKIIVEGLYTHFADAKRKEGVDYTKKQIEIFKSARHAFAEAGFEPIVHVNASPGLMRYEEMDDKLVRLGAVLYGIWPANEMKNEFDKTYDLQPALSWKTIITEVKKIPKGESVGYNRSEILERDSMVAVCPVGYWHGFPASLSSKGIVLVHGQQAKVLGRVSMDMICIDVTDIANVAARDIVTLISNDQESPVSAERVAERAGTFVHELVTRLNPLMKRIFY